MDPKIKSSRKTNKTNKLVKNKKFDNQEKFEEHNIQLQIEAQINNTVTEIQEFLECHYSDDNNHFMISPKEPLVIAKIILMAQRYSILSWEAGSRLERP